MDVHRLDTFDRSVRQWQLSHRHIDQMGLQGDLPDDPFRLILTLTPIGLFHGPGPFLKYLEWRILARQSRLLSGHGVRDTIAHHHGEAWSETITNTKKQ
jgi:hypothetical protein